MSHVFKLLAIVVFVFLAGYFLEGAIDASESIPGTFEETLEVLSELFSVFVAFSIFAITWHSYDKSKDNHSIFLGITFFIVGFLILFHLLSYPFMPEFLTPNSDHKAAIFLIESRIVLAVLLLVSVYIYKDTLPGLTNKRSLFSFAIAISSIFLVIALLYQDSPLAYKIDNYSTETIFLLLMITVVLLYASYRYFKDFKKTRQNNIILLIDGLIIIIFSNLVYFSYEFSGHFLIITGFFFIYLALYKSSVELPYEKLALAEEKLRVAAEDKYRLLFDNANDAMITTDLEDRVSSWNRSAEKIFGWTAQEVRGKKLIQLIVPLELQKNREEIIRETLDGKSATGIDTLCQHKDGRKINVGLTTSLLMGPYKNVIGLSFILRDITERKRAEEEHIMVEEIRNENERLVLENKAKAEFLAIMSHELRTPLNAIIGFSQLMKGNMQGELNEKQKRYIENILIGGNNLLNLVDSILDLTKVETGNMELYFEKMSVHGTINETLSSLKDKAAKQNIVLIHDLDPQLDVIVTDTQKFKHILSNILSNAIKFSKPEGGTVTISTKIEGDNAKFSVSDTGIGIMEKDMEKLFKTFEQLDSGSTRKYGGTGLGLAVSKKLVELMGGRINAESRYGEGSTFTFSLPVGGVDR